MGFVCDCLPGYTGDECETDINECEGQDCSGNGRCMDGEKQLHLSSVSLASLETCAVWRTGMHVNLH